MNSDFFADPRLIVDEHGRDEGRLRLSVLNGTGLPLAAIVVSAELRYRPDDPGPFAMLGPATIETWEPPYFPAGTPTFEFDLSYPPELAAIVDDVTITYVVVASEYRGSLDEDLIDGTIDGAGDGDSE